MKRTQSWKEIIKKWPKFTLCIISNEFCERFSYKGLQSKSNKISGVVRTHRTSVGSATGESPRVKNRKKFGMKMLPDPDSENTNF